MLSLRLAGRLSPPTAKRGQLARDNKTSGAYWFNAAAMSVVHASPIHDAELVGGLWSLDDLGTAPAPRTVRAADTLVVPAPRRKAARRPSGRESDALFRVGDRGAPHNTCPHLGVPGPLRVLPGFEL
jgi:hypothetical protein